MSSPDEFIAITDPGEAGREDHSIVDRLVIQISNLFAWFYPILMMAIVSQVILRQAGHNQAWLDDLQWWLYGAAVLIGIAYAVTTNSHVRVDIFYEGFADAKKARTEVFGLAWLFLPFTLLAWDMTLHYAVASVVADEGSDSPNGLHNLWILKVFLNTSFILIAVAIWAAYVRNLARLTEPLLWKQLFYALPATLFAVNLVIYYAVYWVVRLTGPEDQRVNRITREAPFEEVAFLGYEVSPMVLAAFVVTAILIGAAYMLGRKPAAAKG